MFAIRRSSISVTTTTFSFTFRHYQRACNDIFHNHTTSRYSSSAATQFDSLEDEIEDANQRYKGRIQILPTVQKGWGIFAQKRFQVGNVVMTARPLELSNEPHSHSIQIQGKLHVKMDLPARFANHVCHDANIGIVIPAKWNTPSHPLLIEFHALKTIQPGDEIVWDYEATEYELSTPFDCSCESSNCRGKVRGFKFHGASVVEAYGTNYIAPYLRSKKE